VKSFFVVQKVYKMAFVFYSYGNVNNSNNSIKTFAHENERKLKENNQMEKKVERVSKAPSRTQN